MVIDIILLSIAFIALAIGTITDIRTREVPDWLNYGIIFSGIGLRLLYSSITSDWIYLLEGLAGLVIFVIIGYMMFYASQWGGGDSKLLMGIGALLGLKFTLQPFPLLVVFLFNLLLAGSIYGLCYSIVLAFKHRKAFAKNFKTILYSKPMQRFRNIKFFFLIALVIVLAVLLRGRTIDIFVLLILAALILFLYLSIYLVIFIKAVELAAMYRFVPPEQLTEGDWIAKNVVVNGKVLTGPKDLGIEKKKIRMLIALKRKGKISKIKVKYGIPFVPSFLLAFVLTLMFGAWWLVLF